MIVLLELLLFVAVGLVLGGAYFGGLWYTTLRLPQARHPGYLIAASACIRLGLLAAALYAMAPQGWQALAAGLVGILLARGIFVRVFRAVAP
jgi:F1F0 ATPase subunit 2